MERMSLPLDEAGQVSTAYLTCRGILDDRAPSAMLHD